MSLKAEFVNHSLLYGYSYFWLVAQFTVPNANLPNFKQTHNEHIFRQIYLNLQRRYSSYYDLMNNSFGKQQLDRFLSLAETWRRFSILVGHFVFLTFSIVVTAETQTKLLAHNGITNKSELTYKILSSLAPSYVSIFYC